MNFFKKFQRKLRDAAIACLDKSIPTREEREFGTFCFSQTGEDGVLNYLLPGHGFYVDVGAHHPLRYSNTHMLYRRGWRGINIDPTPGTKKLFDLFRPKDINLEIAVGPKRKEAAFYCFVEGCYNTFDQRRAEELQKKGISALLEVKKIPVEPLRDIVRSVIPAGLTLDLLSVDAEGQDVEILKTHDWQKCRPRFIVVEHHTENSGEWENPRSFLRKLRYALVAHTPFSDIFKDKAPFTKK